MLRLANDFKEVLNQRRTDFAMIRKAQKVSGDAVGRAAVAESDRSLETEPVAAG
jgi:hypothetical protein